MGMQSTLTLQNIARLTSVSKGLVLRTLNHHLSIQSTESAHVLSPSMVSTYTIIFVALE